jgi:16S rRNA (cytidine1402-2'-O)-methyltransferase
MTIEPGVLYVVATPIGHRDDISQRALQVLREVSTVLAEDTRHSGQLLASYGIHTAMQALHEHNESAKVSVIVDALQSGASLALISDAGTPLISDPGFKLVEQLRQRGFRVVPIPGACAIITALSAAGLPTDRFSFLGFLPPKSAARQSRLQTLKTRTETLVFYEAPHRISEMLADVVAVFGGERQAVLCRELTKTFETFLSMSVHDLQQRVMTDLDQQRGEIVLLLQGAAEQELNADDAELQRVLQILNEQELTTRQMVEIAEGLTGLPHKKVYRAALDLKQI